jgi:formate-dependent nitrite reductase membrane component NrfD
MIKLTPQKEWIEGRGVLLLLAMFFGMGASVYLVFSVFDNLLGMLIGLLIVDVLFGGLHFIYLGKPLRFWRMFLRPQTSWISRGLIFVILLNVAGLIEMGAIYWLLGTGIQIAFKVISVILAVLVCIYTGFVMSYVRAIPFWNNALLPVLIVVHEILGGLGVALMLSKINGFGLDIELIEHWSTILLLMSAFLLTIYLWNATYSMRPGPQSVLALLRGPKSFSLPFWIGVILLGVVLPLIVGCYAYYGGGINPFLLFSGIVSELIGGLGLRYCLLKSGFYAPLLPI